MKKQLFGTNGVRGIVGKDMTPDLVLRIGKALGTLRPGKIAVGRDTRTTGPVLVNAIKAGLLETGCDVIDCGILPTPALQYIVKEHCDGGAMITASHNPPEYNGVKIIEPDGTEMGDEETVKLESLLAEKAVSSQSWDSVGTEVAEPQLIEEYVKAVNSRFSGKPGKNMIVVVDPGSGPACRTTPAILQALGCRVITINGIMDGTFPGRLPEPSPDGLKGLAALVLANKAAFGVAHDGDADRAVFIDDQGSFVEENQEFAVVTQQICKKAGSGTIVTPVSTSLAAEIVARGAGCRVRYTPVGSIYVARTMMELEKAGEKVILGGEGNGGLIFPEHQYCRDGGMTAAMMVSLLSESGEKLSSLVQQLPERHMVKEKIFTSHGPRLMELLNTRFSHDSIDLTDGLKISRQNSWALIRASGTEPLVRIMVDAENLEGCQKFYREIKNIVDEILASFV